MYCASCTMSFGKVCGVRSMRMFAFAEGSRRYVWSPLADGAQSVGRARLNPAFSFAWAGWEYVVNPAGSGPVLVMLIASTICVLADGSVPPPAGVVAVPGLVAGVLAGVDAWPGGVLLVVLLCLSRTTVVAPAIAPSTARTTRPIFHHPPDRRPGGGAVGWSGQLPGLSAGPGLADGAGLAAGPVS